MFTANGARALIRTTCQELGKWTLDAEELLLGTAAKESRLGKFLFQIGGGPGRGLMQVEAETELDIWRFLRKPFRDAFLRRFVGVTGVTGPDKDAIIWNPVYSIALARCRYMYVADTIPPARNIIGQARYWDRYYNCNPNYGTPAEYIESYCELVLEDKSLAAGMTATL